MPLLIRTHMLYTDIGYAEENVVAHFFPNCAINQSCGNFCGCMLTRSAEISVVVPGSGGDPAI